MVVQIALAILADSFQEPKVSLEIRGVRLENAMPMIAKAIGVDSFSISPVLKDDVLLIRTKDADRTLLKKNLAKVLNATWEQRPDSLWLIQSAEQKLAENKRSEEERYREFSEIVRMTRKTISEAKPLDDVECNRLIKEIQSIVELPKKTLQSEVTLAKIDAIDHQSPKNRFAYRVIEKITPEIWLKLTDQRPQIVFSTQPTAMQVPFPMKIDDELASMILEQNKWLFHVSDSPLGKKLDPSALYEEGAESNYALGYFDNLTDGTKPITWKDVSTVTMTLSLNFLNIALNAYNARGQLTFQTNVSTYDFIERKKYSADEKVSPPKLSDDATQFLNLLSPDYTIKSPLKVNQKMHRSLIEKLIHPEVSDPLSIAAPEVFLQGIDAPNVIMVLSDDLATDRIAQTRDGTKFVNQDGWCLIAHPNPVAMRKARPERASLGKAIRTLYGAQRPLTLEERAAFAFNLPWEASLLSMFEQYLNLIDSTEIEGSQESAALRVYGSLSENQKTTARHGGISLRSLSDDSKREFFRALFYDPTYDLSVEVESPKVELTPTQQAEFDNYQELVYSGILQERTFLMPNGMTNDMTVEISEDSNDLLYCGRTDIQNDGTSYYYGVPMEAREIGRFLFESKFPTRYARQLRSSGHVDENEIHLARQRNVRITLRVSKYVLLTWPLVQNVITDSKTYTVKNLPAAILKAIKTAYDQAEKEDNTFGNTRYGDPNPRKTIPPPTLTYRT